MSKLIGTFNVFKLSDKMFYLDQDVPYQLYFEFKPEITDLMREHRRGCFEVTVKNTITNRRKVFVKKV